MDAERWQRIKDAFAAALELPTEERAEWLSITLPYDPSLAGEVKKLLAAYEAAGEFYDQGALAALPEVRRQLEGTVEGMRVGPYRVLSELGHGGMGAVYLAVRDDPKFTQKVALKLIKRGMDTDEIVRRFVAERQILASLAHPNIARLFDGGSTPDGRPYFVMEYVEGQPITVYAAERKLSIEERLRLFLRVCGAVQKAHQSLVVHRDLKPANVLVDAEGEPKLLDFGIAKLLDPHSFGEMTALTGLAPGPMTPDYASPEQKAGGPVTTATDVYGLGLLLYELLVGQNPQAVARKLGEGWADRPPSQAILELAEEGDSASRRLARRVSGDLDTIVSKALEQEPARRYGTAAALADDVERHLAQRPVAARRPTLRYRVSRALIRYKLVAALGLGILLSAVSLYEFLAVQQERRRAEAQRQVAQNLNDFVRRMIERADPEQNRGQNLTFRQILDAGNQELLAKDTRYDPITRASLLETLGNTYADLGSYPDARRDLEQALALRERQPDPSREDSLAIAADWTMIGHITFHQDLYSVSRNAYLRAIAIKKECLGSDALPLVPDWNGLAVIAFAEGKPEKAGPYLAKSLAVSRTATESQRELAETLNDLGNRAVSKAELDRAQVLFGEAWHYFRLTLGADHPDTLLAESNVAYALSRRGEYAAAETLYQEVADLRRRVEGPDHPEFSEALLNLAIAQRACGRLTPARATLAELLQIRHDHRFPADSSEAETWNFLGDIDLDENQLGAAEEAFKKSFEIYRSLPGDHRSNLANVLAGQAQARRRRTDLIGALALARRSLELTRASEGEKGPSFAESLTAVAELLQQEGQFHRAELAYLQALKLLSGPGWQHHTDKARVVIGLGSLLVETNRAGEAQPYLEDGLSIRWQAHLGNDAETARAESELGACYTALGDGRARARLEHAYQRLLDLQGSNHPDTRKAMDRLRRLGTSAG